MRGRKPRYTAHTRGWTQLCLKHSLQDVTKTKGNDFEDYFLKRVSGATDLGAKFV